MSVEPSLQLTDAQRFDWLRLWRSESIGPRTFRILINRFGSARAALEALPRLALSAKSARIASIEEMGIITVAKQDTSGSEIPVSLKSLDDRIGKSSKFAERGNNWLIRKKFGFIERYISTDLKIALRRVDVGPRYYGAILEARPDHGKMQATDHGLWRDGNSIRDEMDANQPFMLPRDVELVECKEKVVPSTVRLQIFDDSQIGGGQPLFSFSHVYWVKKLLDGRVNGKVGITTSFFAIACGDGRAKEIKARANAIDGCPNSSINDWRQSSIHLELEELLAHFRVRLFDNQIRGFIKPGFDHLLQDWELGFGPIHSSISV